MRSSLDGCGLVRILTRSCYGMIWQSEHNLKNKEELLVLLRGLHEGVPMGDLKDSYPEIATDIQVLMVES